MPAVKDTASRNEFKVVTFWCFFLLVAAGDGVLWSRFDHRFGEEHKGEPAERRLDRLHFQRDP